MLYPLFCCFLLGHYSENLCYCLHTLKIISVFRMQDLCTFFNLPLELHSGHITEQDREELARFMGNKGTAIANSIITLQIQGKQRYNGF